MQVKEGKRMRPAKSTTTKEIEDIIPLFWPKALQDMVDMKIKGGALLSMDNIKIQANANAKGLYKRHRVVLPPYSPDMHKVVEHCIGNLKRAVHQRLYKQDYRVTSQQVQQILREEFYCKDEQGQEIPEKKEAFIKSIRADSDDLINTYRANSMEEGEEFVDDKGKVHRGTGGNWPKSGLR